MRLPSVSYWPPWHGQPKPAAAAVGIRVTTLLLAVLSVFVSSASGRPFTWTGQPRWTQRLETIVKLGLSPRKPLLRMYAVRRETSPSAGLSMYVAITNLFSGKSSIAPTSIFGWPCLMKGGRTVKPSTGAVTTTPIRAPRPSVVASRNFERG